MGLDMNIYKSKMTSDNWEQVVKENKGGKVKRVYEETDMLYLRKANQIHNYIVENFGDGIDECQKIRLTIEDITGLRDICQRVIDASELIDDYSVGGFGCECYDVGTDVELLKKAKDANNLPCFVPAGKKKAEELKVGDLIASKYDSKSAEKVGEIKRDGDKITAHYNGVYVCKVIKDSSLAKELLRTQSGFFFGSTEYDEWYLADLKSYVEQADEIIADYKDEIANGTKDYDIEYYYQASW